MPPWLALQQGDQLLQVYRRKPRGNQEDLRDLCEQRDWREVPLRVVPIACVAMVVTNNVYPSGTARATASAATAPAAPGLFSTRTGRPSTDCIGPAMSRATMSGTPP